MKTYSIGDKVWLASYGMKRLRKDCPVCYGNKDVTLILGNDDEVRLPCGYCGRGFDEPSGVVTVYEPVAETEAAIITKIMTETGPDGESHKYAFGNRFVEDGDIFDTKEEAAARAAEKAEEQNKTELEKAYHLKNRVYKSFAWNAGYHLRQAGEERRRAEYHEKMAILCKARVKGGSDAD